jgi:hypothetical protein
MAIQKKKSSTAADAPRNKSTPASPRTTARSGSEFQILKEIIEENSTLKARIMHFMEEKIPEAKRTTLTKLIEDVQSAAKKGKK